MLLDDSFGSVFLLKFSPFFFNLKINKKIIINGIIPEMTSKIDSSMIGALHIAGKSLNYSAELI